MAAAVVSIGAAAGLWWWTAGPDVMAGAPVRVAGATQTRAGPGDLAPTIRGAVHRVEVSACGTLRQGTASAVTLGGRRWVLTNRHVVAGARQVRLGAPGSERPGSARVDGWVPGRDVAVLAGAPEPSLPVGPRPDPGDRVQVVGYPGGDFRVSAGTVRSVEERHGFGGSSDVLIVDVPAAPGLSGGLVADGAGRGVGLVVARDPATGWTVAYPLDIIGSLLADRRAGRTSC